MNVLLIGGHLTPLLATIAELKKRPHVKLLVISRKYATEGDKNPSLESQILSKEGVSLHFITTGRLQRHFTRYTTQSVLKIPIGFFQALTICMKQKPAVIVSFGGYLALPVCFAGFLLQIPIVLHEQSTQAGLANRVTAIFAQKICISWESSRKHFPEKKTTYTGNPVRQEIFRTSAVSHTVRKFLEQRVLPLLYVTGGNQGSHIINGIVFSCLPQLLENYTLLHQIGGANSTDLISAQNFARSLPYEVRSRYLPIKFVSSEDIGAVLHAAKIIIARAGANTVTETICLGKPAIFIPLPWAQKNEQRENARIISDVHGGILLEQKDLTPASLLSSLENIQKEYETYILNMQKIRNLIPQDAAAQIVDQMYQVRSKNP